MINSNLEKLIEKCGSKQAAADKLMITVRYIDIILSGKKVPSKRLQKMIEIALTMA